MSRIIVAPVVEGHGDVAAVPLLIRRVWTELLGGDYVNVLTPIRQPRNRLAQNHNRTLERAVRLATMKLAEVQVPDSQLLVLILIDADEDAACRLGPDMLSKSAQAAAGVACSCVLAVVEYESWFVGSASTLGDHVKLKDADKLPIKPEQSRSGKRWIESRFKGVRYSETVDQPRMTAKMDLAECRVNCPSFDKLCRELERFIDPKTTD